MSEFYTKSEYNKLVQKLKSRELTIERLRTKILRLEAELKAAKPNL